MATIPDWFDSPDLWNTCYLQGIQVPGKVEVEVSVAQKLDVKETRGANGANIAFQGYTPASVTITVTLFAREHLPAFVALFKIIRPRVAKQYQNKDNKGYPPAVDISHPATALTGVTSVYIEDVSVKPPDDHQIMVVTMKAVEWFKPGKPIPIKNINSSFAGSDNVAAPVGAPGPAGAQQGPPAPPSASDPSPL